MYTVSRYWIIWTAFVVVRSFILVTGTSSLQLRDDIKLMVVEGLWLYYSYMYVSMAIIAHAASRELAAIYAPVVYSPCYVFCRFPNFDIL